MTFEHSSNEYATVYISGLSPLLYMETVSRFSEECSIAYTDDIQTLLGCQSSRHHNRYYTQQFTIHNYLSHTWRTVLFYARTSVTLTNMYLTTYTPLLDYSWGPPYNYFTQFSGFTVINHLFMNI